MRRLLVLGLLLATPALADGLSVSRKGQYQCTGTGCVSRTMASKEGDIVNVLDFKGNDGLQTQCDGAHDDTSAIQAALTAVLNAGGGTVNLPCGKTCIVKPSGTSTYLTVGSGTTLRGCGASSVIKVANNAGNYRMIFSLPQSQGDADVAFRDFKVDQNPTGNTSGVDIRAVGTSCPSGTNTCQQYVVFYWPLSPNTDTRVTFDGMVFDPTDGVNTITIGSDGQLATTITRSYFNFVQGPTADSNGYYDNSSIYLEGSQQVVTDNTFISTYANHANGAIETHGGRSSLSNNTIVKYAAGINIASTQASFTELSPNNIAINNNTITDTQFGINIYPTTGHTTRNVVINGNVVGVSNADRSGTGTLFNVGYAGIRTVYDTSGVYNGDVEQLTIQDNIVTMQKENRAYSGDYLSGGILLYHQGSLLNAQVTGNIVRDCPAAGIRALSALGSFKRLRIADNTIIDAGNNTTLANFRVSIELQNTINDSEVIRNFIYDTGAAGSILGSNSMAFFLSGATNLRVWGNTVTSAGGYNFPVNGGGSTGIIASDGTQDIQAFTVGAGGTTFPDANAFGRYEFAANAATGAFTVSSPANPVTGKQITIRIKNISGGAMGAITWNAIYHMGTWTNPANTFNRSITFQFDGTNWVEVGRTPIDVAN